MHPAVAIGLLALGVAALVAPRPAFSAWVGPPVLAAVAVASGVIGPSAAGRAVRPLDAPLAFVLFAVPFAVLLDRFGFFSLLAERASGGRRTLGTYWVLAGLVVALLNLDAAVVLLTPLYLRIADRRGLSRVQLGFQPLLLSCLASSALPISNLTNLIAASALHLSTAGFLVHLALPTLAASGAGYVAYRRIGGRLAALGAADGPSPGGTPPPGGRPGVPTPHPSPPARGRRTLVPSPRRQAAAGVLVVAVVAGFLAAPSLGGQPWQVAAGGDLLLMLATGRLPLAAVPWKVVLTVVGLGVLASAAAGPLRVTSLFAGSGLAGVAAHVGLGVAGANLVNNLPALLVALPGLARHGGFSGWSFLLGDNLGPLVLPAASLAGLLWIETMRRLGTPVRERDYLRVGWRVALPALAAGTGALLLLRVLLGPN